MKNNKYTTIPRSIYIILYSTMIKNTLLMVTVTRHLYERIGLRHINILETNFFNNDNNNN